jgi:hypothetical protein
VLLTPQKLRASVAAVAKDVAGAYAQFEPPFSDEEVADRFARVRGVHPAVADRLAAAYRSMLNDPGDGGKAAVLVASGIVRAALGRLLAEGRANFPPAIELAAGRSAEQLAAFVQLVRNPAELLRAATTAAGGDDAIGKALLEAFSKAGRDGCIQVDSGTDGPPGVTVVDVGNLDGAGWVEKVVVRGPTEAETRALYNRACGAMHAARAAVAEGVVAGGGVAYARAGGPETDPDANDLTGLAEQAVGRGLEVPLRVRAKAVGLDADAIVARARNRSNVAFDQSKPGLVSDANGPLDPLRVVRGAIREAGRAACDLLRLAL